MTHKDIFTKFMIEYDKANVTSSYPSLTEYEIATFLDKAYMALIAQKVTGNNVRRAPFEADVKSISDLAPIIITETCNLSSDNTISTNVKKATLPKKFLYFVDANANVSLINMPLDGNQSRTLPVKLLNHAIASKFFSSAYNLPWVKEPIAYIEEDKIKVVIDPINHSTINSLKITYVKYPNSFVKEKLTSGESFSEPSQNDSDARKALWNFELNDTVAEELISLAITYALENVESSRLNAHLGIRGLES